MRFDFNSIYEQELPIYIHSNTFTFKMAFQESDFESFLENLVDNLISTLEKDIKYFENIEQTIVDKKIAEFKELNLEPAFNNKDEYLEYLRAYKIRTEQNSAGTEGLYGAVNFKRKQASHQKAQDSARKSIINLYAKKKNIKNPTSVKLSLDEILSDPELDSETKREINQIVDHYNTELQESSEEIAEYLSLLLVTLFEVYDPTSLPKSKTGMETSASRVEKRLEFVANQFQKTNVTQTKAKLKTPKEIKKDMINMIRREGPLAFLAHLRDPSQVSRFFGAYFNDKLNSPLGEIYEVLQKNAILKTIEKDIKAKIFPVFDKKKVILTGELQDIREVNTIDMAFDSFENLGIKTIFGASLKLIFDDRTIKVETDSNKLWGSFISFLGKKEVFKYSYLRQNLFALQEFYADSENSQINFDLNFLAGFEKRLFSILSANRLFLGLYETLENQEKKSVEKIDGDFKDTLYFAAYLWETDNIYRATDILKLILNDLKTLKTSDKIKYDIGLFHKPNEITLSRDKLEELYKKKQKNMKEMIEINKKISYKEFLRDNDIISILNDLNKTIGRHGYEGKQTNIAVQPKKLAELFPQSEK